MQDAYDFASRTFDLTERIAVMWEHGMICRDCGLILGSVVNQPRSCSSCQQERNPNRISDPKRAIHET